MNESRFIDEKPFFQFTKRNLISNHQWKWKHHHNAYDEWFQWVEKHEKWKAALKVQQLEAISQPRPFDAEVLHAACASLCSHLDPFAATIHGYSPTRRISGDTKRFAASLLQFLSHLDGKNCVMADDVYQTNSHRWIRLLFKYLPASRRMKTLSLSNFFENTTNWTLWTSVNIWETPLALASIKTVKTPCSRPKRPF